MGNKQPAAVVTNGDEAMREAKKEYRNNELLADFKTLFSEPVLTTYLHKIEKHAANIYTQEIFKEVKQEIEKANALIVSERSINGENLNFTLKKYCSPARKLFECRGIPCSHIISVLRSEDMDHIPTSLICACNNFAKVAAKKRNYLTNILDDIRKLTIKYEKIDEKVCTSVNLTVEDVGDPTKRNDNSNKDDKDEQVSHSECSDNGGPNDNEEDVKPSVERNLHEMIVQDSSQQKSNEQQTNGESSNKGKDKFLGGSKHKEKKAKQVLKPKHATEMKKTKGSSSGRGNVDVSQGLALAAPVHVPAYHYGSFSHRMWLFPNIDDFHLKGKCQGPWHILLSMF
ncbi:FAR1-related protein [Sesbania bispinosa]|nr:FAR1-related protein [Sesbania bispinosa]